MRSSRRIHLLSSQGSRGILPFSQKRAVVESPISICGVVDRGSVVDVQWRGWSLPGQGEAYDDCGSFGLRGCLDRENHHRKVVVFVDDEGVSHEKVLPEGAVYVQKFKRNCGRKECPMHYETWASKVAHGIEARVQKVLKDDREGVNVLGKPIHVAFSPSSEVVSGFSLKYLRDWMHEVARKVGLKTGVVIVHPFRRKCRFCGHKPIDSTKDVCPECGSKSFVWYFSLHFHVIGFGWIDGDKVKEVTKSGWVVKNLGVRDSVYATAQYLLSHAGVHEGYHTVTWFGALDWCDPPVIHSEKCPYCGASLRPVKPLKGAEKLPEKEGDYFLVSDLWVYAENLIVFGSVPREFEENPTLEDGSVNWGALLLVK